ncbi:AMP binding protein [Artomyces pyxidatus]|uniref:AMP binding protein n=1 Tax=Artomyces pyxidatus TaxID=48021 RepID=A0ACB8SPH7_9AGAM|nr:AMP binding protein [Artomyces pyxidatus]
MTIYTSPLPSVDIPSESIWTFLFNTCKHDLALPAYIDAPTGRTLTRADVRALSLQFAYGARSRLRIARGDTAMIFSPNSLAWPVALLGLVAAGARATLANSAYTPPELAYQYTDSGARVVFAHPDLVGVVREMFKLLKVPEEEAQARLVVLELGGTGDVARKEGLLALESLLGTGALESEEKFTAEQAANETLLLCYSSGTTGKPKGVETTHRNLISVMAIIKPVQLQLQPGKDVLLGVLPFYHIYGVVKLVLYPLSAGIPVAIMPKFDAEQFCRNIERYRVTTIWVVPPIILALVHHPAVMKYNMTSLCYLSSGAAPLGAAMVSAAIKRLKSVGATVDIAQGYGLTETSPVTHLLPRAHAQRKVGSIGILLPNLEARLVVDDESDAKEGEPGELWVRGPVVMKGYLNNPSATANAITPDGWFKTGDVAVVDSEGFYQIVDRKKELIKYKGFQVPPAELESVLLQHPDIVDVAVIGIDDPAQATELPRAYVAHKAGPSGAPPSFPKDVEAWIKSRVAKHKYLRGGVVVIDAIPKSAAGKILRRQLRDLAKAEVKVDAPVMAKL